MSGYYSDDTGMNIVKRLIVNDGLIS